MNHIRIIGSMDYYINQDKIGLNKTIRVVEVVFPSTDLGKGKKSQNYKNGQFLAQRKKMLFSQRFDDTLISGSYDVNGVEVDPVSAPVLDLRR